jgi:hypothetical protein
MWSVCTRLGVTPTIVSRQRTRRHTRRWAAGDENLWNERSSISSFLRDTLRYTRQLHQATANRGCCPAAGGGAACAAAFAIVVQVQVTS